MTRSMLALLTVLVILLALYAAALAWVWLRQERLLFQPQRLPPDAPLAHEADVQEVSVPVEGAQLSALHLRLPRPRGLVFYLHGNAGNLQSWFVAAERYRAANYDLFMLDYRGYGKSGGQIQSEAQLRADVRSAWDQVTPAYQGRPLVLVGRSLGTALAAGLSAQLSLAGRPPALTVLVSPYRSMAALAAHHYPWLPLSLLRYPLNTEDDVARLRGPLLILHGRLDTLIPQQHSDALLLAARAAAVSADLVKIDGAAHSDLQEFDSYQRAYFGALPE